MDITWGKAGRISISGGRNIEVSRRHGNSLKTQFKGPGGL